ncbi:MAG: ABC transporter ATP-binding protein [Deltaproteobacteria bacterium]|nr:ABC transporter ATP-binding protein [Deltaproteobacteria bacterium]MBI3076887.1 ABC transporter ATP-binding protein [Deltaproteobacteria bacterium]
MDLRMEYYQPRTGGRLLALDSINLEVYDGEFVSIVGPSGCGKTTFLNIADGLLQRTGGQILLEGRPVSKPGPDRAVVFQDSSLLPWRTVLKNVIYGLELQRRDLKEAGRRAQEFVQMVGLKGFEHHYPHELSGGMQQRVNLARALTMDPEILFMDEPFASLDAQTREIMQLELLNIWQQANKTVLFITHQINEAVYLADRVIVFSSRPSRVKEVVEIRLPRPRPLSLKRSKEFLDYEDYVWKIIEDEVRKTMLADRTIKHLEMLG